MGAGNLNIRTAVARMAERMEAQLKANDSRGGWKNCSDDYLIERIEANLGDLMTAHGEALHRTCADICNFAMMISDNEDSE